MTVKEDSIMVKIMKPLVVILLSAVLSLLSILYWDVKKDIETINTRNHIADSLKIEERAERKIERFSDSLLAVHLYNSVENLNLKIEELGR